MLGFLETIIKSTTRMDFDRLIKDIFVVRDVVWTHDVFIVTVIVIVLSVFTFANITNCEHVKII